MTHVRCIQGEYCGLAQIVMDKLDSAVLLEKLRVCMIPGQLGAKLNLNLPVSNLNKLRDRVGPFFALVLYERDACLYLDRGRELGLLRTERIAHVDGLLSFACLERRDKRRRAILPGGHIFLMNWGIFRLRS